MLRILHKFVAYYNVDVLGIGKRLHIFITTHVKCGYGNDEKEKKLLERTKGEKINGQANYTLVHLYVWSMRETNKFFANFVQSQSSVSAING